MAVRSVIAPHAMRWLSRATRMMQRFVVGEKYFTDAMPGMAGMEFV